MKNYRKNNTESAALLGTVEVLRRWLLEHVCKIDCRRVSAPHPLKRSETLSRLKTPREAAKYLGVAEKTLSNWRSLGLGPTYRKIGGRVAYDLDELRAFIDQGSVSQPARKGCV